MADLSRGMAAVAERLHRAEGMAREYQAWIDFFHAGEGDYADFLRKHVFPKEEATPGVEVRPLVRCAAGRDGDCAHAQCPQLRDGEPKRSGRHCPLDVDDEDARGVKGLDPAKHTAAEIHGCEVTKWSNQQCVHGTYGCTATHGVPASLATWTEVDEELKRILLANDEVLHNLRLLVRRIAPGVGIPQPEQETNHG